MAYIKHNLNMKKQIKHKGQKTIYHTNTTQYIDIKAEFRNKEQYLK